MSDLISRSELLKAFNNKNVQITFDLPVEEVLGEDVDLDDFSILVQDAIQAYKKMVIDTIKNQPTAYDIDKVVEELLALNKNYNDGINLYEEVAEIPTEEAIEIVKQGGVSDVVCEWNQNKGGVGLKAYKISCFGKTLEMPASTARGLKYCPYCGKKIKVVE